MALAVTTDLPAIVPVRDPQWFEVHCGRYQINPGERAKFTLEVSTNPSPGNTFTIIVEGVEMNFEWVDGVADDSGLQAGVGEDPADTTLRLKSALVGNFILAEFFQITIESGTIQFLAHTAKPMSVTFNEPASSHLVWTEVTSGESPEYAPNYKALYRPLMETTPGSDIFDPLPVQSGDPDAAHHTRWPVHEMLKPSLRPSWPEYSSTNVTVCTNLTRRFILQRWEQFGDPPTPNRVYESLVKTAWYAGSRNAEHHKLQDIFTLITRTDVKNPFLTYRGRGGRHEVSPGQRHYLSFYRRTDFDSDNRMRLQVTVHYSDGTSVQTIALTESGTAWQKGLVATVPTGFEALNLHNLQPTKWPVKYVVSLGQSNTFANALSEQHTFWLVPTDANELNISYINSLGVVDSIRCDARWVHGMRVENSPIERLRYPMYNVWPSPDEAGRRHVLVGVDQYLEVSTGYMDRSELEACMDILFSPEIRIDDPVRGMRHTLILEAAEHIMKEQGDPEREHLYALNLRFLIGDREAAWSLRNLLPEVPNYPDPGADPPPPEDPDEPIPPSNE